MSEINLINSYENTDELLKMFKVLNPTPVTTQLEKDIQNRLLTGFANWNQGYETWQAWGDILYTSDSLYNLYGIHMTFPEYQFSQKIGLSQVDMQLGDFYNMLICDDWTAIRYSCSQTNRQTGDKEDVIVMEFVNFKDYGSPLRTRVVEGWASTRGRNTEGISHFITAEELQAQQQKFAEVEAYQIPQTDDLEKKYPVLHPTLSCSVNAEEMKAIVLKDFDAYNQGNEAYQQFILENYTNDYVHQVNAEPVMDLAQYQQYAKDEIEGIRKLYFDNMLISGSWAAIHYRITRVNPQTGKKEAGDRMQFIEFGQENGRLKIKGCYTM